MAGTHTSGRLFSGALVIVKAGSAATAPKRLLPLVRLSQRYDGAGLIEGTTKIKGSPNRPDYSRVILIRERDFTVIREVWSDPSTGRFRFEFIDRSQTYTLVTYDETHNFRAVAADNITPDLMT